MRRRRGWGGEGRRWYLRLERSRLELLRWVDPAVCGGLVSTGGASRGRSMPHRTRTGRDSDKEPAAVSEVVECAQRVVWPRRGGRRFGGVLDLLESRLRSLLRLRDRDLGRWARGWC